jgi:hypothetical protein
MTFARIFALHRQHDIAGGGFLLEMQLGTANFELTEHLFDALSDRRMVGAVASDEFFDDRPQSSGRQQPVGNKHGTARLGAANLKVALAMP